MMRCSRCGEDTPRLTLTQRYCQPCAREVAAILLAEAVRESRRRFTAKDMSERFAA